MKKSNVRAQWAFQCMEKTDDRKKVLLIFTRCYFHSISLNKQIIFAIDPDESKTGIHFSVLFFSFFSHYLFRFVCAFGAIFLWIRLSYILALNLFATNSNCKRLTRDWNICLPTVWFKITMYNGSGGKFRTSKEFSIISFRNGLHPICCELFECVHSEHQMCVHMDSHFLHRFRYYDYKCSLSNFDFISCLYCAFQIANCWASCQAYSDLFHGRDKYFPDLEVSMINLKTFKYA